MPLERSELKPDLEIPDEDISPKFEEGNSIQLELEFQFKSLEDVISQNQLSDEGWQNAYSSSGGDFLKKGGFEWVFKEPGKDKEISLSKAVEGTAIETEHKQILEDLYSKGFSIYEFQKKDENILVRQISFADSKGRISHKTFEKSFTKVERSITNNDIFDLENDDDDLVVQVPKQNNSTTFGFGSILKTSTNKLDTAAETGAWETFWNDLLKSKTVEQVQESEENNLLSLFTLQNSAPKEQGEVLQKQELSFLTLFEPSPLEATLHKEPEAVSAEDLDNYDKVLKMVATEPKLAVEFLVTSTKVLAKSKTELQDITEIEKQAAEDTRIVFLSESTEKSKQPTPVRKVNTLEGKGKSNSGITLEPPKTQADIAKPFIVASELKIQPAALKRDTLSLTRAIWESYQPIKLETDLTAIVVPEQGDDEATFIVKNAISQTLEPLNQTNLLETEKNQDNAKENFIPQPITIYKAPNELTAQTVEATKTSKVDRINSPTTLPTRQLESKPLIKVLDNKIYNAGKEKIRDVNLEANTEPIKDVIVKVNEQPKAQNKESTSDKAEILNQRSNFITINNQGFVKPATTIEVGTSQEATKPDESTKLEREPAAFVAKKELGAIYIDKKVVAFEDTIEMTNEVDEAEIVLPTKIQKPELIYKNLETIKKIVLDQIYVNTALPEKNLIQTESKTVQPIAQTVKFISIKPEAVIIEQRTQSKKTEPVTTALTQQIAALNKVIGKQISPKRVEVIKTETIIQVPQKPSMATNKELPARVQKEVLLKKSYDSASTRAILETLVKLQKPTQVKTPVRISAPNSTKNKIELISSQQPAIAVNRRSLLTKAEARSVASFTEGRNKIGTSSAVTDTTDELLISTTQTNSIKLAA